VVEIIIIIPSYYQPFFVFCALFVVIIIIISQITAQFIIAISLIADLEKIKKSELIKEHLIFEDACQVLKKVFLVNFLLF